MLFFFFSLFVYILGIGGQVDMKLIFGTIVAEEKGKVGKEDKVIFIHLFFIRVLGFVTNVRLGCVPLGPRDLGLGLGEWSWVPDSGSVKVVWPE